MSTWLCFVLNPFILLLCSSVSTPGYKVTRNHFHFFQDGDFSPRVRVAVSTQSWARLAHSLQDPAVTTHTFCLRFARQCALQFCIFQSIRSSCSWVWINEFWYSRNWRHVFCSYTSASFPHASAPHLPSLHFHPKALVKRTRK